MKKRIHANNYCILIPPVVGPAGLVCWQEGYSIAAVCLGLVFVVLGVVGAVTARLHWVGEPRDRARARRIAEAIERDGYWISD